MKQSISILFTLLLLLLGCSKQDESELFCSISSPEILSDTLAFIINKPSSKDNFILEVYTMRDFKSYNPFNDLTIEDLNAIIDWKRSLHSNGLKEYVVKGNHNQYFTYAGIADGAKIYADKILWGRDAGEDLGDMFAIRWYYNDVIVSYPDFRVLYGPSDKHPETFREFTSQRIALNGIQACVTSLTFAEIPPEVLDTVTFTVEIPIDVEYFKDYPPEMYEQHPNLKPEGRRLLKGSTTVKFDTSE